MLEKFRQFSNTIFAKIFLFIVAIPFVFWGMGNLFTGGNLNTIVKIDQKKISTDKFIKYIRRYSDPSKNIDKDEIEIFLSNFIGEYLMEQEQKSFNINLSDSSLAKIIRNQEFFKEENKFSRIKYEKFLIKNKISAVSFEKSLIKQEGKKQLLDIIGGGIIPSEFMVNIDYNKINQERVVDIINLNDLTKQKINVNEQKIKEYFEANKENYKVIYKSINIIELNPKNLIEDDEFSELFFNRIDQIDDLVVEGKNLKFILKKFDLGKPEKIIFDKKGENKNLNKNKKLSQDLITKIFKIENIGDVILSDENNKYFLVELVNIENIQREIEDDLVKKEIISKIKNSEKINIILTLLSNIKRGIFNKQQFLKASNENNIQIKQIKFKSVNDKTNLEAELVNQIYSLPENKVGIVYNNNFKKSYLVYIDEINNVSIVKNSTEFKKYSDLSELHLTGNLYKTYDKYLKNKYKIKINYNALNNIKNYF